ncbi:hypothetical protein GCM10011594_31580 [Nakamurella endophytica]|uniref:Uncharacterized protein n=1 Tax=Nakamurella endophytica TaxID=1748367 RepID=A0A917T3X8_9ACTN|nr:hypothetical protein GCM10011594_31580 [Nakamurella endophytica]
MRWGWWLLVAAWVTVSVYAAVAAVEPVIIELDDLGADPVDCGSALFAAAHRPPACTPAAIASQLNETRTLLVLSAVLLAGVVAVLLRRRRSRLTPTACSQPPTPETARGRQRPSCPAATIIDLQRLQRLSASNTPPPSANREDPVTTAHRRGPVPYAGLST